LPEAVGWSGRDVASADPFFALRAESRRSVAFAESFR
jgi:hypothetical protein